MKKHFLVTVELPDWAAKDDRLELVREEIEQHAGACVAFYTRATHVSAKCLPVERSWADSEIYFQKP